MEGLRRPDECGGGCRRVAAVYQLRCEPPGRAALALWAARQSAEGIAFAMFNEFGALYALVPAGFLFASPSLRRLAIVSVPVALLFAYVEQPDRALWNFHYLVAPMAALVL